jgi:ubiquinone/menaquinone biosynthesis C-methylase UbiE
MLKNVEYTSTASRKQFKVLLDEAPTALAQALPRSLVNAMNVIKKHANEGDEAVYKELRKQYIEKMSEEKVDKAAIDKYRVEARTRDLSSFLDINKLKTKVKSYLDFGGGDGVISNGVADMLNIAKDKAFSADVDSWFSNMLLGSNTSDKNVTFITIKDNKLPFADKQIDFVTAFVVLHHLPNLEASLKEIYRVMNDGAILVIREHDCKNNITRMIIDVIHAIYEMVLNADNEEAKYDEQYLDKYFADYKDKFTWSKILEDNGFKYLNLKYPPIKPKDHQRIYYAAYVKK